MTDEMRNKKSRRRFLADMLFIGGGVTAAALLAKSQLLESTGPSHSPEIAGAMVAPQTDSTPKICETPRAPLPGEPLPPDVDGDFALPEEPSVHMKGESIPPTHREPKLGGKPVAPKPDGECR